MATSEDSHRHQSQPSDCDLPRRWQRLGDTGGAFAARMIELASAGARGFERRSLRAGTVCGERALQQLLSISDPRDLKQLRSAQRRCVSECSDACMEEVRNAEQIALLTHTELSWWRREFLQRWSELLTNSGQRCAPRS